MSDPTIRRIAFIGNYLPRRCGIATFTTDLCTATSARYPEITAFAVPVTDRPQGYQYPSQVRFELNENEIDSYRRAADFLNIQNVEAVSLQHEYGIFGGQAGGHILALLRDLRAPVVTTLHTILRKPTEQQRRVMTQLAQLSSRLVTMSARGVKMLQEIYNVPPDKIDLIPHGIHDVPFVDPNFYKDQFGVEGKVTLLTFGLLSPNKGIENVIEALPKIVKEHPEVMYIVLGATHPNLIAAEGETYRLSLQRLAESRGVQKHIVFYNRFVETEELQEFIGAADIYITPYLYEEQITSGTLSYAFGAGKAVVSTPYWHAEELLADGRGVLVPFRDSAAIAQAVTDLLENDSKRHAMRKQAYIVGREMIWAKVAERYLESFERARATRTANFRRTFTIKSIEDRPYQLPPLKLRHLFHISDSTGILQHARFSVPLLSEGYCTDDNARAFILTVLLEEIGEEVEISEALLQAGTKYLAFLFHAYNPENNRFRNFMGYDRRWLEDAGSEDSHGRALWALGTAMGRSRQPGFCQLAGELFHEALPLVEQFTWARGCAFSLIAIHEYLRRFAGDRLVNQIRDILTERLAKMYKKNAGKDWRWFENTVTYDNARLSHAMILSGYWTSHPEVLEIGLESLRWLAQIQRGQGGVFRPVGCNGFYPRNGTCAQFDQQPLEACAMVSACLEAYRVTQDTFWTEEAERCFEWYLGRNDLGIPLYDSQTGGCRDGLHMDRANENQGAESSLSYYLSFAEMRLAQNMIELSKGLEVSA